MAIRDMHEWFSHSRYHTPAYFMPGIEYGRGTHLEIRDSFKVMAGAMKLIREPELEDDYMWEVEYLGKKYRLSLRVNKKGSNLADDYEVLKKDKARALLKEVLKQRVRIVQILVHQHWMQILLAQDKKRYGVEVILLDEMHD